MRRIFFGLTLLLFTGLLLGGFVWDYWDERQLSALPDQPSTAPGGKVSLVVNVATRMLVVYNDGKPYKKYRIAVGKSDTPTPIGEWTVSWKSYRSGDILGTRFLGLDVPWGGYGIHGTNSPWSIGKFISQGCIRLRNRDIEELFEWVPVGTPVRIEGRELRIGRALRYAVSGPDVVVLQQRLRQLGYLEGRADGFFNRDTETAVKGFQHDRRQKADGVVDHKTLELLGL